MCTCPAHVCPARELPVACRCLLHVVCCMLSVASCPVRELPVACCMRCRVRGAGVRRGGLCIAIGRYATVAVSRRQCVAALCALSAMQPRQKGGLCLDGQRVLHDLPAHEAGVHTRACMRRTRMLATHHITRRATARRPIAAHRIPPPARASQCHCLRNSFSRASAATTSSFSACSSP